MEMVQTFMNPITGEDIIGTKDELKPVDFIDEDRHGVKKLPKTTREFDDYIARISKNPMNKTLLYQRIKKGKYRRLD